MTLPETPSFRLDGRRAVVTGAGRGIGLAIAAALAQAGAHVTLVARTASEIEAGAAQLVAQGLHAEAATLDVSDLDAVADFFAAREAFHVLVNNAGTNRPKPMWEAEEADYDAVMDLNVKSAFFVAQGCARKMIAAGVKGSLIHMGSQMGHVGGPNRSLYCASKWAMEGMNKAFALDLAAHGIRSNTLAPGEAIEGEGPYGNSYLRCDNGRPVVCIAGGSGLSPVMSILKGIAADAHFDGRRVLFFYGGRGAQDICAPALLAAEPALVGRVELHTAISDDAAPGAADWDGERGFVHELARRHLGEDLAGYEYYFCGPPPMTDAVHRMLLLEAKVPAGQLHFDRFY